MRLIFICEDNFFKYFSPQVEFFVRLTQRDNLRMKRLAVLLTVIFFSFIARGQQDPQISQNMFNRLMINPAYAGSNEAICGTLLHRQQWSGFEGAPQTTIFAADMSINSKQAWLDKNGVGLGFMSDQLGNLNYTNLKLAYTHRMAFGFAPGFFSLGVDVGFIQQSVREDWVANDPYEIDPSIPGGISTTALDLGLGLYYYNGENYYGGISVAHLLEPTFESTLLNPNGTGYDFAFPQYRTFYFHGGHNFRQFNTMTPLQLRHSLYVKTQLSQWQLDYNINLLINSFFWIGPSIRLDKTVSILGGMDFGAVSPNLEGLKLGLAYDVSATSEFSRYNSGSFEVMINYCYQIVPPIKIRKYRTVKWL